MPKCRMRIRMACLLSQPIEERSDKLLSRRRKEALIEKSKIDQGFTPSREQGCRGRAVSGAPAWPELPATECPQARREVRKLQALVVVV